MSENDKQIIDEKIFKVLLAPRQTEKSIMLGMHRQYAFQVKRDANKPEIKKAVESLFKVIVESVHVTNAKGKAKRFGQTMGRRSPYKKAYVKLAEGHTINFGGA